MDLFKRLCSQNQQRKFNAIWKLLDEFTAKHQAVNSSGSSSGRTTKPFSQWIQDKPKLKWALLYDTNGRRYGIMTTNHAECYNMVMRNSRGFPLVGIVEFILYGCAKYFRERYMAVSADLSNPSVLFGKRITKYMETKTDKAQNHNARLMGTRENMFEVSCRDRSRRGVRRERTVQESLIGNDGTIHCSCMKPALLHLPCSHVLAACRELSVDPTNFVSTFYTKGAIASTWNQELFRYGMVRAYTAPNPLKWYIPDPSLKKLKGRRQTRRIRNVPVAAEAGPSGNATDGAPPSFELPSASRARSQRSVSTRAGMAEEGSTPDLLDPVIDSGHRSYLSAVEHKSLGTFQCRPPKEVLELDDRWLQRLRGVGLLTFCRLVEGGPVGRHGRPRLRLMIDNSLITALVDRWRPETHTFHLPWDAVEPRVVPASWRDDLEVRFARVDRLDHLGPLDPHPNSRGPAKAWLLQFQATNLHPDTDDDSVRRSLEAYLLWLFGFIMFKNGTSNSADKVLIPYAQEIEDAPEDAIPLWSWGSAVLAATYHGLCDACMKDETNARGNEAQYYGEHDDDGPTMGTIWVCPRERTWAHEQARRTYPNFVVELDRLVAHDVIWEPYSPAAVASLAPYGLSSWCTPDVALCYTRASLVYDIYIEAHSVDRVMRQFGYAQQFPVARAIDRVSQQDHRYFPYYKCTTTNVNHVTMQMNLHILFYFRLSRLGQPCLAVWVHKLQSYVEAWSHAGEDVVHPVGPHMDKCPFSSLSSLIIGEISVHVSTMTWYHGTWYRPCTRCHITYADTQLVPHEATSTDAYARHRDEALAGEVSQSFNSFFLSVNIGHYETYNKLGECADADMLPTTVKCPWGANAGTRRQPFYPKRAVAGVDYGERKNPCHDASMGYIP
ncbi:hypothetical protein U9M48_041614 [Paspalum notatum var. saurae]|uniref:SWIM-type domain-containing protein n=1 Tax=Paspalum notatum var. saurae TaxID=547442 RepID=A0AAQ3XEC5_PASNO